MAWLRAVGRTLSGARPPGKAGTGIVQVRDLLRGLAEEAADSSVNRRSNTCYERVFDADTGMELRRVEHPLSEHTGTRGHCAGIRRS
jgi:hypothetical protein